MKKNLDTERLDWLERNLLQLYHAQQTCSVYMGGEKIFGQLLNEARGSEGGPTRFQVKHKTIREAVDAAMNWKNNKA